MHRNAKLKCIAYPRSLDAIANTTPERCVEQNNIDRSIQGIRCKLLEVENYRIGRKKNAHHLPDTPHSVQTINGILEVVISQAFNRLAKSNRLLRRPYTVGIESQ